MILRSIASALSPFWALTNALARRTKTHAWRCPCTVVSVGNIVAGGVGKTELAAWIAARYLARGKRTVLAMRGYGSPELAKRGAFASSYADGLAQKFPDEALLHLKKNPNVLVVVGANRSEVLRRFWRELCPDIVILDDGYQHFAISRDLDVLVHDFSQKRPILRDFFGQLERAQLRVCLSSTEASTVVPLKWKEKPWVRATYEISGVVTLESYRSSESPTFSVAVLPTRAMLFCGIGNPARVQESLSARGTKTVACKIFNDHVQYDQQQMNELGRWVEAQDLELNEALPILVTAKDAVKLFYHDSPWLSRVRVIEIRLKFLENESLFQHALDGLI